MSPTTMWMYAALNPHLHAGGLPPIESTKEDYLAMANPETKKDLVGKMLKAFKPDVTLPDCIPKPCVMKKKWKPAKHDANRDAGASSVFIAMDSDHDFAHAPFVWQGVLQNILALCYISLACWFGYFGLLH